MGGINQRVERYMYYFEPFEDKVITISLERDGKIEIEQRNFVFPSDSEVVRISYKSSLKNLSYMFENLLSVVNQFQAFEDKVNE